jgi:hypothetical protein
MFQNNVFLQVISLVTLTMLLILLAAAFIPYIECEVCGEENPTVFRAFIVLLIMALLRGAF